MEEAAYHTREGVSYVFSENEDELICRVRQRCSVREYAEFKSAWERKKGLSTTYIDKRVWALRKGLVPGREGVWARVEGR